jgi:hypothetical protein
MTTAAANTIRLAGPDGVQEEFIVASGASIKPGSLIRRTTATECNVHNVAGGDAPCLIVLEDGFRSDRGTDDAYAAADRLYAEYAISGAKRYLRLKASENVAIGDTLISGGDGTFIKSTGTVLKAFAIVEEASNIGATQNLIQARII